MTMWLLRTSRTWSPEFMRKQFVIASPTQGPAALMTIFERTIWVVFVAVFCKVTCQCPSFCLAEVTLVRTNISAPWFWASRALRTTRRESSIQQWEYSYGFFIFLVVVHPRVRHPNLTTAFRATICDRQDDHRGKDRTG